MPFLWTPDPKIHWLMAFKAYQCFNFIVAVHVFIFFSNRNGKDVTSVVSFRKLDCKHQTQVLWVFRNCTFDSKSFEIQRNYAFFNPKDLRSKGSRSTGLGPDGNRWTAENQSAKQTNTFLDIDNILILKLNCASQM